MKTISFILLCFSVLISDPFAPKAEKPKNPNNDPDIALAITFLESVIVPDKESVGFPVYNDAKIFQTTKAGELGSQLNMVRTFSKESIEKVIEFYRQNIPSDWNYEEFYGTHFLYSGDKDEAMMAQIPSIQITNADNFKVMWSEANVIITIYYK
jgi:hypothetical protein